MNWFMPKTHGYGAYPANWKGWAVIAAFAAAEMAVLGGLVVWPILAGGQPSVARFVVAMLLCLALTLGLLWFTRRKTAGEWRWRWGDRRP